MGPMGAQVNEEHFRQMVEADMRMMSSQTTFKKKKKIERHRFADGPGNARALHNQLMKSEEQNMIEYNTRPTIPMSHTAMTGFYRPYGASSMTTANKNLISMKHDRPTTAPQPN